MPGRGMGGRECADTDGEKVHMEECDLGPGVEGGG